MNKESCEKAFIEVPFALEMKELNADNKFFQFEGYASTFGNIDRTDDVIVNGAFSKSIAQLQSDLKQLPILWQHDRDTPLGVYFEVKEDEKGLFVKGRMPKSDTFVSGRVIPQMEVGSITKMSIGFWIMEREYREDDGVRIIKEADVFEISLVTLPANPKADITGMKSLDEVKTLADIESFLKSHNISNKQAETIISKVTELKKLDADNQAKLALKEAKAQGDLDALKELGEAINKYKKEL